MGDKYVLFTSLSAVATLIASMALYKANLASKRVDDSIKKAELEFKEIADGIKEEKEVVDVMSIATPEELAKGDAVDASRTRICKAIDDVKIAMFDEIEKLVHIKNRLEADLDRDPSDAIAVAKLGEIKTLIKVASKYYELEV
jgi:hypothetical protein